MTETFWGILIPFLGTSLGAACVFFMRRALYIVILANILLAGSCMMELFRL